MRTHRNMRKLSLNVIYFGIPILVALSSAVFQISTFVRQAMVGFVIIWCLAGGWLLDLFGEGNL